MKDLLQIISPILIIVFIVYAHENKAPWYVWFLGLATLGGSIQVSKQS
jgi:hypothetical protein